MDELRGRLPTLVESVLEEQTLTEEFPTIRLVGKSEPAAYVLNKQDSLLTETNAAIADVRAARAGLENYEDSAVIIPGTHDAKSPVGVAMLSFGLSTGAAVPAAIWVVWSSV